MPPSAVHSEDPHGGGDDGDEGGGVARLAPGERVALVQELCRRESLLQVRACASEGRTCVR